MIDKKNHHATFVSGQDTVTVIRNENNLFQNCSLNFLQD